MGCLRSVEIAIWRLWRGPIGKWSACPPQRIVTFQFQAHSDLGVSKPNAVVAVLPIPLPRRSILRPRWLWRRVRQEGSSCLQCVPTIVPVSIYVCGNQQTRVRPGTINKVLLLVITLTKQFPINCLPRWVCRRPAASVELEVGRVEDKRLVLRSIVGCEILVSDVSELDLGNVRLTA